MMHIRIGVQTMSSSQLESVARLAREYGNGTIHATASQDLEIREVTVEAVPVVLEGLLEAGLLARDGAADPACNVVACPRAGVCPRERFNVAPYALAVTAYLRQSDGSCRMVRECKIAFSGCPSDCALAAVADLGFFTAVREGVKGFTVNAGGGLVPHPAVGVQLEAFVRADEVFEVVEAVARLVDEPEGKASDHKVSLRAVAERLGADGFIHCYQEARADIRAEGLACDVLVVMGQMPRAEDGSCADIAPDGRASGVPLEKRDGSHTLRVRLSRGDISAEHLIEVARVAQRYGVGLVHATPQRQLLVPAVSQTHLEAARSALRHLDAST